jgi:hypothetical protein
MPSYLNFNSTKELRNSILARTLTKQNGPQTFTSSNYAIQSLRDIPNVNPGDVDDNRADMLKVPQTNNVYKPTNFNVTENLRTIPRRANLNLYPYFQLQNHNLISVFKQQNLTNESELMKFAGTHLLSNSGPVFSRIAQNIERVTNGRDRLGEALNGSVSTASNIISGREPLVAPNYEITVSKTIPGKIIDFVQVASGVELPFSDIPGDYLTDPQNPINVRPVANSEFGRVLQDVTGALGSLIGISRRPSPSRKPSDLFIEHMGSGQKNVLYDLLSYSTYAPNYTSSARSQNTSRLFNVVGNIAQGVANLLGIDAPIGQAYIGDDRGNDVKFAMNDFNDRPVRSNYYLSLLFDPVQTQLFQRKRNYSDNGSITGKLTWISRNNRNKLGENNQEWESQKNDFDNSTSTGFDFRPDSILGYTQDILDTLPTNGAEARSHVANVIDQTSRIFREGDVMLSRGSAVQYVDKFGGESGVEYCRVWTKDRSYLNYSDTMKRQQNVRKYDDSVLDRSWNLNIAPISNGGRDFNGSTNILPSGDGFYAKKYMFSIENLAWKTSNTPGFTVNDLPYCERGPNGGRVMWFPPYDLKVSEQNSASWNPNKFLGRPEPIYTYQNTERTGQISFKVVVDHPSILNLLVREHFKGFSDEESENYINAFFAGCEEIDFYDLIRRYSTITPEDAKLVSDFLNKETDIDTILRYQSVTTANVVQPEPTIVNDTSETVKLNVSLNFANNWPLISGKEEFKGTKYSDIYVTQIGSDTWTGDTLNNLTITLNEILTGSTTYKKADAIHDKKILYGKDIPVGDASTYKNNTISDLNREISDARSGYDSYLNETTKLKTDIESGIVKDLSIVIGSSCSALADNGYNFRLSIRRTYSILLDILDRIKKDVDSKSVLDSKWPASFTGGGNQQTNIDLEFTLKELGYTESDGKLKFTTISAGEVFNNESNINCSTQDFKFVSTTGGSSLKIAAPVAFGCRQSRIIFEYTKVTKPDPQKPQTPADPTVISKLVPVGEPTTPRPNRPAIDPLKRIIMKTLSECYYFQKVEESDPVVFKTLKEKLKYFHPAFHSTTPEGLNSRLTFLLQCVRPGDTIPIKGLSDTSDLNARNTSFGPPPVCVLRVGDFYHSKVIIKDVNITFEDSTWDLNPEGIGVQPMIASVTLQISFIGGQGLSRPVERLQNALSSNFFANTEMYDERSINTAETIDGKKREEFTKALLEELNNRKVSNEDSTNDSKGNELTEGEFIGVVSSTSLRYDGLVNTLYEVSEKYFENYPTLYNLMVKDYGTSISSMILHPNYRDVKTYDIFNTTSPSEGLTIDLFGEYPKSRPLSYYINVLKIKMTQVLETTNISEMMDFDSILSVPKQSKANELLQPYFKKFIEDEINSISSKTQLNDFIKVRNEVIDAFDKLNFIVKYGYDVKIDKDVLTQGTLSGFTYDLLYDEYENCVNYIQENTDKLYEDLDTTINFNTPDISTDTLSELLSVLLKEEDRTRFMAVFSGDTIIFDEKTIEKITKKFESFISSPPKDKNFKFKKLKNRKNEKEISFLVTESELNDDEIKKEVKKLKSKNNIPPTDDKLNYFKL